MFKTKFSTLLLLLFVCTGIKAQTSTPPVDYIPVRAAAPEVASLGKFGNIPVSYCTGVPSITIPVTSITVGKINLPVSLDYHASGIRVDEVSSCVGIGWALSGNGMIFRNLVGLPDETATYGYIASPDGQLVSMAGSGSSTYSDYLFKIHQGLADAEPDIFQYNFNGQSGKFVFRHDGTVMQIPATNNKIVYSGGSFTATDANGIVYIFDEKQNTISTAEPLNYVSQWRLTKIIDVNKADTIYFTYDSTCNATYEQTVTGTFTVGMTDGTCSIAQSGSQTYSQFSPAQGTLAKDYYQNTTHYESYLKQISWRGGKIVFLNACDRSDVTGSGERLDEIDVYALINGTYTQTKKVKLYQSYFFSNPTNTTVSDKNYRLRLDSVAQLAVGSSDQPQVYRMTYDTTAMAPRQGFVMDRWGMNNGKFSESGSIPKQTVLYNNNYYNIGSANRESDSAYMQACNIKSITYPTKGKTVFEFEPHRYRTNLSKATTQSAYAYATGGVQSSVTTNFTVSTKSYNYSVTGYLSQFNSASVTNPPYISITDQATSQEVYHFAQTGATVNSAITSGPAFINLTPGHTYTIVVNIYTATDSKVNGNVQLTWADTLQNVPEIKKGGGLRVKTITNYDLNNKFLSREKYEYGDDSTGVILTPQYYQDINFEKVEHRIGCTGGSLDAQCVLHYESQELPTPGYSYIYHGNSIFPITQFAGSPVLYRKVTQYQVDSTRNSNGKTVHYFQVYQDGSTLSNNGVSDQLPSEYFVNGIYLISNNWKNGVPLGDDVYKSVGSNFVLQARKRIQYFAYSADQLNVLKIKPRYLSSGCESSSDYPVSCYAVPITTGAMMAISTTDTTYDDAGNMMATYENLSYNSDLLLNYRQTLKSNRDSMTETMSYPSDLAVPGNVYSRMVNRHIINPVVRSKTVIAGQQIMLTNFNYADWFGDSTLLMPSNIEIQHRNNLPEVRVKYNSFDRKGNILQQQKANDMYMSYIWDYQNLSPVAIVQNAAVKDIAFTSFEAEGNGNWSNISSGNIVSATGVTGNHYYNLTSAGISKTGLTTGVTYIVSYFSKNGPYSVLGTSPVKTGRSATIGGNTWTYYEHQVSGTTISIIGSGGIDELRLYPIGAQMNTYTFAPLIGITSQCDANSQVIYNEYDGMGRLKVTRDQDGNIIKMNEYHFREQ